MKIPIATNYSVSSACVGIFNVCWKQQTNEEVAPMGEVSNPANK